MQAFTSVIKLSSSILFVIYPIRRHESTQTDSGRHL